ncbi:hypothetical protein [Chryseobacterium sp. SIMBA_038]|uniref:hypothetical protein n=1 Tax=Chryseobacterium sp. SIMBA_038 TaxID=3085780 RepID=UPI00397A3FF4
MTQIIINLSNKEEETFVETFLKKMKISFEKNEDDFQMTDEMVEAIEVALKQDKSKAVDGKESLKRIRSKYGL